MLSLQENRQWLIQYLELVLNFLSSCLSLLSSGIAIWTTVPSHCSHLTQVQYLIKISTYHGKSVDIGWFCAGRERASLDSNCRKDLRWQPQLEVLPWPLRCHKETVIEHQETSPKFLYSWALAGAQSGNSGSFFLSVPTGPAPAMVSKLPLWLALIVSLGTLVLERAFVGSHESPLTQSLH